MAFKGFDHVSIIFNSSYCGLCDVFKLVRRENANKSWILKSFSKTTDFYKTYKQKLPVRYYKGTEVFCPVINYNPRSAGWSVTPPIRAWGVFILSSMKSSRNRVFRNAFRRRANELKGHISSKQLGARCNLNLKYFGIFAIRRVCATEGLIRWGIYYN